MFADSVVALREADEALCKYFGHLYLLGFGPGRLRFALYGFLLLRTHCDGNVTRPLPRATKMIKGVVKARPGLSLDPWPEFVILAIASAVCSRYGWMPALAVVLQYDTYLRTINLLRVRKCHFVPPQVLVRQFSKAWSLCVGTPRLPLKNGSFGFAIIVGDLRPWLVDALARAYSRLPSEGEIFDWTHREYHDMINCALSDLSLPLRVTPHQLRHSGPSNDRFGKTRSLEEIRRRGTWKNPKSVEIYEKHASLLQSVKSLTPGMQKQCLDLAASFKLQFASLISETRPSIERPRKRLKRKTHTIAFNPLT